MVFEPCVAGQEKRTSVEGEGILFVEENLQMARIYRSQSREHGKLIPTALRCQNYKWLEKNIEYPCWIDALNKNPMKYSEPKNPEYYPFRDSAKAYYLSLINIVKTIHNDKCLQDCEEFRFSDSGYYDIFKYFKDGRFYTLEESIKIFSDNFHNLICELLDFAKLEAYSPHRLPYLKLSSYFQHFNHRKGKRSNECLGCGKKGEFYPTMCLDFSYSIATLNECGFIKEDSIVYSIEVDKVPQSFYYSFEQKYDYKIHDGILEVPINENTNVLMESQKGYCIYWPWDYSIDELKKNRMFGFEEVSPGDYR